MKNQPRNYETLEPVNPAVLSLNVPVTTLSYRNALGNRVSIELSVKFGCLSVSASLYDKHAHHAFAVGQCREDVANEFPQLTAFTALWQEWHRNDCQVGTAAQQQALLDSTGLSVSFDAKKTLLAHIDLNPDRGYSYGSSWLFKPLTLSALKSIFSTLYAAKPYAVSGVVAIDNACVISTVHNNDKGYSLTECSKLANQFNANADAALFYVVQPHGTRYALAAYAVPTDLTDSTDLTDLTDLTDSEAGVK